MIKFLLTILLVIIIHKLIKPNYKFMYHFILINLKKIFTKKVLKISLTVIFTLVTVTAIYKTYIWYIQKLQEDKYDRYYSLVNIAANKNKVYKIQPKNNLPGMLLSYDKYLISGAIVSVSKDGLILESGADSVSIEWDYKKYPSYFNSLESGVAITLVCNDNITEAFNPFKNLPHSFVLKQCIPFKFKNLVLPDFTSNPNLLDCLKIIPSNSSWVDVNPDVTYKYKSSFDNILLCQATNDIFYKKEKLMNAQMLLNKLNIKQVADDNLQLESLYSIYSEYYDYIIQNKGNNNDSY